MRRRRYTVRLVVLAVLLGIFAANWWGTHRQVETRNGGYFDHAEFAPAESFFRTCTIVTASILLATALIAIIRRGSKGR
ncbi:MAG: hypothetical protein QOG98_1420 [Pseudonocardiales bacterium]|nr:hypothetical protein [Pseudonocardiales bacterium]